MRIDEMERDVYNFRQVFSPSGCITQEMLMGYAAGTLSKVEIRTVELHLADCEACSEALEGIQMVGVEAFAKMQKDLEAAIAQRISQQETAEVDDQEAKVIEFRPQPTVAARQGLVPPSASKSRNWTKYIGIAASFVLIAVVSVLLLRNPKSGLANEYFVDMDMGRTRSIESPAAVEDVFQKGLNLFQEEKYAEAAAVFDQDDSIRSTVYAANCYFRIEDYAKAETRFKKVVDANGNFHDVAEFNLAVTYLKLDREDDCRKVLSKISSDDNHDYQKKATELLKEL
jgi:tetratricopeptide (TPR) repeat protein